MKDLVKNPIGIIALFISMIYGFANLLLGTTASSLTPEERYPLIMFIVLFPVVVLGIYYLLVSRHHGKLYAPGDYKDDKSFLRTLSEEERELKLTKETLEALPTPVESEPQPGLPSPPTTTPGLSAPGVAARSEEMRSELREIEASVVTKFEAELGVSSRRDVGIGGTEISFDAMFETPGKFTFLEVKSVRHPSTLGMTLDRVLYNAVVADKTLSSNFKLILAVVYHFDRADLKRFERIWRKRIEGCPAAVELRLIPREELGA